MKIKGYTPADPTIAIEVGVELSIATKYGDFNLRIKSTGRDNVGFRKANDKLTKRRDIQARTGYQPPNEQQMRDTLELWFDNVVISWATTVVDDDTDKPFPSTRENFIKLLSMEIFIPVFLQVIDDSQDHENFVKDAEADTTKN